MTILAPAKIHISGKPTWAIDSVNGDFMWGFYVGISCENMVVDVVGSLFSLCFDNPFPVEWRGFDILSSIYQQSIHPSIHLSIDR
jgi:hypothetical protein